MDNEIWFDSSSEKIGIPSPKGSTQISVMLCDLISSSNHASTFNQKSSPFEIWPTFLWEVFFCVFWIVRCSKGLHHQDLHLHLHPYWEECSYVHMQTNTRNPEDLWTGYDNGSQNRTYQQGIMYFVALIQLGDHRSKAILHGHLDSEHSQWGLSWTNHTVLKLEAIIVSIIEEVKSTNECTSCLKAFQTLDAVWHAVAVNAFSCAGCLKMLPIQ